MSGIYIHGWHGQGNFGDDAFAAVTAWGARHFWNAGAVYLATDSLHTLKQFGLTRTFGAPYSQLGSLRFIMHRRRSNAFVLAGGNLLPTEAAAVCLLADEFWVKNSKPEIAIGISVGPFESQAHEQVTEELLNRFRFIGFRDEYSYMWARSKPLKSRFELCFDLATLLPKLMESNPQPIRKKPCLGLSLMSQRPNEVNNSNVSSEIRTLAQLFSRKLRGTEFELELFALCVNASYDDTTICRQFAAECTIPARIFQHAGDPIATYERLSACTHIVSMRLHGCVMAFTANVPFLMLSYHPKCHEFADSVRLPAEFLIDVASLSIEELEASLDKLLSTEQPNAATKVSQSQTLALQNFHGSAIPLQIPG